MSMSRLLKSSFATLRQAQGERKKLEDARPETPSGSEHEPRVFQQPTKPRIWVLLGKGAGGNAQMQNLAETLRWPHETKQLVYNRWQHGPNILLGPSLLSLDLRRSSPLTPPFPDLVIAASRRSAPVALWIKRQSGGRTRLVHLMHTQAPLHWFDLIITTPQYGLPDLPNVLHNTGPLNVLDEQRLAKAAARWGARIGDLPRPFFAVLVGGNSSSYVLDPATARRLGQEASAEARSAGGSLLVSTSPRTPRAAADALFAALDCPARTYRWKTDDAENNPYLGYLALADRLIVTVDSASQLVEACATGKPVALFDWPRKAPRGIKPKRLLRRWGEHRRNRAASLGSARRERWSDHLYDRLVYWGLVKPPRDFAAFHRALMARGLLSKLGERNVMSNPRPLDDMERAVARVKALFGES
jgi:hypothetical protein